MKKEIIKSIFGKVLFEYKYKCTIKKTLEEAVKQKVNLTLANLAYANLAHANLTHANLAYANLAHANLALANLAYADLAYADLAHTNLAYADLAYANLAYADLAYADLAHTNLAYANLAHANLAYADLAYANLAYAKNFKNIYKSQLYILKHQKGKLRAFKYLDGNKSPYQNYEYEVGKTYTFDDFNINENVLCGKGGNVATLDWCLRDTNCDLSKTYIEVEFDAEDIVAIPYCSDGKFRVKNFTIIRKLTDEELIEYMEGK